MTAPGSAADDARKGSAPSPGPSPGAAAPDLAGRLPCARCKYDLQGLSIRAVCPECGTPVRATILAVVDPRAEELKPIRVPLFTAYGMITWSTSALAGAVCVWVLRVEDLLNGWQAPTVRLAYVAVGLVALSGLGAVSLVAPHRGMSVMHRVLTGCGVLLYGPLCWLLWLIHANLDDWSASPYGLNSIPAAHRTIARILALSVMGAIVLCLRPHARVLYQRSLLMRTGRQDRQTMAAMLAVLGLLAAGDALNLAAGQTHGPIVDIARQVAQLTILVGSVLFTLGLVGLTVDSWRLRSVILEPPLSLSRVLGRRSGDRGEPGPAREVGA